MCQEVWEDSFPWKAIFMASAWNYEELLLGYSQKRMILTDLGKHEVYISGRQIWRNSTFSNSLDCFHPCSHLKVKDSFAALEKCSLLDHLRSAIYLQCQHLGSSTWCSSEDLLSWSLNLHFPLPLMASTSIEERNSHWIYFEKEDLEVNLTFYILALFYLSWEDP